MRYAWNEDWLFTKDASQGFDQAETVRLPHNVQDMAVNYCNDKDYQMLCGYQKTFSFQPSWEEKRIFITFDGAAHEAEVFLNEKSLYKHTCGYTSFSIELTEHLLKGENTLLVKLDTRESLDQPPFGYVIDYMTYGGLYREVWLDVKEPVFIEDVFVTTKGTKLKAEVTLNTKIKPEDSILPENRTQKQEIKVFLSTYRPDSEPDDSLFQNVVEPAPLLSKIPFPDAQSKDNWQELGNISLVTASEKGVGKTSGVIEADCKGCELWDTENPALYELWLVMNENENEPYRVVFGFRDIEFRTTGFYLNGKKVKLRGLNRHQCYPYVGYAMPASMQIEDVRILKEELGVNAVRTSHYPQSQHFFHACDRLGLLVFTEIPGWQHIGDENWQEIAVNNVRDMILQNRNHPSIILWGVRINESLDNDTFYKRTNDLAHKLDSTRPTSGVRYLEQSHLLEDVYAYNDFSYTGTEPHPLRPKAKVSSDQSKPYFVSEFNGHMYPTKMFDDEKHRLKHALRYAKILQDMYQHDEILGCFGWCMFDYNTHKDFGSGDRVCYHGVMDMFRNPKLAAAVYRSQQDAEDFLELSSNMDIGEHTGGSIGSVTAFTNADSVRLYKNDVFVREFQAGDGFLADAGSTNPAKNMPHPPIYIDDFIGELLETQEGYDHSLAKKLKDCLSGIQEYGQESLPLSYKMKIGRLMLFHGFTFEKGVELFGKYIGNWGGEATVYRLEGIKNGEVVTTLYRRPVEKIQLETKASHITLVEKATYDVASIRIRAVDDYGNPLPYYQEPVKFQVTGEIELIGPDIISLKGGAGGCYVKSTGKSGEGRLKIHAGALGTEELIFHTICETE